MGDASSVAGDDRVAHRQEQTPHPPSSWRTAGTTSSRPGALLGAIRGVAARLEALAVAARNLACEADDGEYRAALQDAPRFLEHPSRHRPAAPPGDTAA